MSANQVESSLCITISTPDEENDEAEVEKITLSACSRTCHLPTPMSGLKRTSLSGGGTWDGRSILSRASNYSSNYKSQNIFLIIVFISIFIIGFLIGGFTVKYTLCESQIEPVKVNHVLRQSAV